MLDTIDAGGDRVTRVNDFEMAHDRNSSRMRGVNRYFDQSQRQTKVDFDRGSTVVYKTIYRESCLVSVSNDVRVSRIRCGGGVEMRAAKKKPRHGRSSLARPV